MLFDTELLRVTAFWIGGFIQFPRGRGGLEGQTRPGGSLLFGTRYAPGWVEKSVTEDLRQNHQGPLRAGLAKWRGLYLNGEHVTLSYTVGPAAILETPGTDTRGGHRVVTRTFSTSGLAQETALLIVDVPGGKGTVDAEGVAAIEFGEGVLLVGPLGVPKLARLEVAENGRVKLMLPPLGPKTTFQLVMWGGAKSQRLNNADLLKPSVAMPDPTALAKPGPARWGAPLETRGQTRHGRTARTSSTKSRCPIRIRSSTWLRPGGHDFFPNGDAALVNLSGDVWIVSGLDDKLEQVKWKRFATGLFQPLGCKSRGRQDLRAGPRPDHAAARSQRRRRGGLLRELQQRLRGDGELPRVRARSRRPTARAISTTRKARRGRRPM